MNILQYIVLLLLSLCDGEKHTHTHTLPNQKRASFAHQSLLTALQFIVIVIFFTCYIGLEHNLRYHQDYNHEDLTIQLCNRQDLLQMQ